MLTQQTVLMRTDTACLELLKAWHLDLVYDLFIYSCFVSTVSTFSSIQDFYIQLFSLRYSLIVFLLLLPMTLQSMLELCPHLYWSFLIAHIHQTHGRTPLDKWSARRRGLYLHGTKQHINTRDKHPCPQRDSNSRSQPPSGHRDRLLAHLLAANV
jgi:hypothetical protein